VHPRHTPALALRVARSAPVQQARGAAALAAERPSARMLASLLSRTRTRRDVGGRHSPARLWCSARIADEIVDYCSVAMRESRAPDRGFGDCLRGRGASVEHCSSRPPSCVGSAGAPSRPETRGPGFRVRLPAVAPSGASAVLIGAMRAARAFTRSASTRSQRVRRILAITARTQATLFGRRCRVATRSARPRSSRWS
jgi:hypothetical protein